MEKLLLKVKKWKKGGASKGSGQAESSLAAGGAHPDVAEVAEPLPVPLIQERTGLNATGPSRDILPGASNITMQHAHFQTADRINNTYINQTHGGSEANETLRLLGNPNKGCVWDPSRACLPGTRVAQIEAILSWALTLEDTTGEPGARILLVPGPAGSGKSALSHTVCKELDRKGLLVGSVFFDQTGQQPTAEDFTIALIRGLCSVNGSVKDAIIQLITQNHGLTSASAARQVEDIIIPILNNLPPDRNYVVGIDALDEQPNPSILKLLRDHVPRLPSTFRFVLTTRPDPRVMKYLENRPHIILFSQSLVGDNSQADVKIFILDRLSKTDYSETIPPKLLTTFIAKSEGLFLWAETVLNHIDNAYDHAAELADIVAGASSHWVKAETATKKLEALYEHILSKLPWTDDRLVEKYNIVMGALVTLHEPLSCQGLAALYEPAGITESDVHRVCTLVRPLLKGYSKDSPRQPICLLHLSVQEYLVQQAPQPYRIDCAVHHRRLSRLSLLVIQKDLTPDNDIPHLGYSEGDWVWGIPMPYIPFVPTLLRGSISEHLWYSIRYASAHERHGGSEKVDDEHEALLRDVVVDNSRAFLEMAASTGSMVDIILLQRKALPNGTQDIAHARWMAKAYFSMAVCLYGAKRKAEALPLFQEVVSLYRLHKDEDPSLSVELEFATGLTWLGDCLEFIDRSDDALPLVEEALSVFRRLSLTHPYIPGEEASVDAENVQVQLGWTLESLAWSLFACGRHDEAIPLGNEAIEVRRQLAAKDPTQKAYLADSLHNHATYLEGVGRRDEAIALAQESLDMRRELGLENPERFADKLSESMRKLAYNLYSSDQLDEAITLSQEMVEIDRRLAENDASYNRDLAFSLFDHALYLRSVGRTAEAVGHLTEAVAIRRQLDPDVYLAYCLADLAYSLNACDRWEEAIPLSEEAIDMCRQLWTTDKSKHEAYFSGILDQHATYLENAGRKGESSAFAKEADEVSNRLAGDN
ncbi:TPR-like protein [Coprinopsis marcescibilis]|uniref:TPR-like protein n=1 Tax=Coprinopsis marcescibilis TaxID=230819 RepID=A0A5C3KR29_COPMA|nr:TPR-like protein [Coprinopsis marcescibilis]